MAKLNWIPITKQLPPINKEVLFCCLIDDYFTSVRLGTYRGQQTQGAAVVMEMHEDDWSPCSNWMFLPDVPEVETAKQKNKDE